MRNKLDKQKKMIAVITAHYAALGRVKIPTMSVYALEELMKVMQLFKLEQAMHEILSS
jgi:predicted metal-dependent RNase